MFRASRILSLCLLALALAAARGGVALADDWAELTGKFIYDGTAPTPKPIIIDATVLNGGSLLMPMKLQKARK